MKYLIILITLILTSCDPSREERIAQFQYQQLQGQSSGLSHNGWKPDMTPVQTANYNWQQSEIKALKTKYPLLK